MNLALTNAATHLGTLFVHSIDVLKIDCSVTCSIHRFFCALPSVAVFLPGRISKQDEQPLIDALQEFGPHSPYTKMGEGGHAHF